MTDNSNGNMENAALEQSAQIEQPKRKRGRPSKAELAARAAAAAELERQQQEAAALLEQENAEPQPQPQSQLQEEVAEVEQAPENSATVSDVVPAGKKRRSKKTKEEILAKANAAAAALAQTNKLKAQSATSQSFDFPEENEENEVPEASFSKANSENDSETSSLIEQLQNKVSNARPESLNGSVWEGDPNDGTDFIVVEDIPVEDNGAIPYYDMLDNPQLSSSGAYQDDMTSDESEFEFNDIIMANGLLEIMPDGYGFLRSSDYNYLSSPDDVHLTVQQIKQYSLKTGDVVECYVRPPHSGERYFTMSTIKRVNGRDPYDVRDRISFENLTPLFPNEKFNLCGDPRTTTNSTRIVDLFSPIGKGQRSLIVAQPKTGKTILMKDIANAIAANHPEAYIMMLLIDERPEEVTDMARTVNAEVVASTFDEPADRHVKIAGLVLEKAKRLVECGHDVVIFLDSITRLARAYNAVSPASGKVLTGGVDSNALQKPKRFFGAARNIEGGGSLTIIATALTDTGSKMDEVIFEEFKGTGNSELQLDRQLANKRIFPAVNLVQSSTRRDDLLLDSLTVSMMGPIRDYIAEMNTKEAMTVISEALRNSRDNSSFFKSIQK